MIRAFAVLTALAGATLTVAPEVPVKPAVQVPEEAWAEAFQHARTVTGRGSIQVSEESFGASVAMSLGARRAGLGYGPDSVAVECNAAACRARSNFRGLVYVDAYERLHADSVAVTLRMLRFTARYGPVYEQVDEVHVRRAGAAGAWHIAGVKRISET